MGCGKAKSTAQREAVAIAEHHPKELFKRNSAMKTMTHKEQHKIASTKEKGLPEYKGSKGKK